MPGRRAVPATPRRGHARDGHEHGGRHGLLRHAADNLGLKEAYGMVGADNTVSLAMARRLGFRHVRDVVGDDGTVTKMVVISTTDPD
ncbi:hypothetical protein WJ438_04770 [Streptomyces sp. GD-15H]|uniref:hypothetical protein n=1 Tax=Streptomyces sp. GD-15H TaxID=3129112 RepID=UPI003254B51E